ncbi:hypothetical protein ACFYOK_29620 [Microbispora bryophytorum]|uniref:hypothetical protein n=1 Tax=Microbispora bryophytorum TaxID=1460882 RepID=UPI0033D0AE74
MAYTEQRGDKWRVRWKLANGKYSGGVTHDEKTGEPFTSEDEARQYGEDQETLIRLGLRKDPDKLTLGEWAATWYAGLALEPSTMRTYRSLLVGHLLPFWEQRPLHTLRAEEFDPWERSIIRAGYAPRTAQDARRLMINILGDAVPRYIPTNPAARKRGKGRKGVKRVEAYQRAVKVWPSPLETVLIAERAALLAGESDDVFAMFVTKAWTGARWSELLAFGPQSLLPDGMLDIDSKLYELSGFYLGYPKDGSLRAVDLPPFLAALLRDVAGRARACTCSGRAERPPVDGDEVVEWCTGRRRYLFLTAEGAHFGRGWSSATMRAAADGVYPGRDDRRWPRPPRPVLADAAVYGPAPPRGRAQALAGDAWPGRPVRTPWPYAVAGEEFVPPRGRGRPDWPNWPEAERPHLVTWLPIRPGLTPHGFRHGHQTWMDDAAIKKALKVERMGHEDTSMSGRYGHVTEGMREELRSVLQGLWENAIAERFKVWPTSPVPVLDAELARWREGQADKVISQFSPRNSRRALPA